MYARGSGSRVTVWQAILVWFLLFSLKFERKNPLFEIAKYDLCRLQIRYGIQALDPSVIMNNFLPVVAHSTVVNA